MGQLCEFKVAQEFCCTSKNPFDAYLMIGLFFLCLKKLSFEIFRYSWTKDGKPFDWTYFNDRMTQQPGRGTLVIKSPRDEDVGKICKLSQTQPFVNGILK